VRFYDAKYRNIRTNARVAFVVDEVTAASIEGADRDPPPPGRSRHRSPTRQTSPLGSGQTVDHQPVGVINHLAQLVVFD
jgi:hypothetical protein